MSRSKKKEARRTGTGELWSNWSSVYSLSLCAQQHVLHICCRTAKLLWWWWGNWCANPAGENRGMIQNIQDETMQSDLLRHQQSIMGWWFRYDLLSCGMRECGYEPGLTYLHKVHLKTQSKGSPENSRGSCETGIRTISTKIPSPQTIMNRITTKT